MFKRFNYALLGAALLAGCILVTGAAKDDFAFGKNLEILVNLFRDISMYYVDETDPDKLLEDAATGMTSHLDPYTEYLSAKDMEDFAAITSGKYGGIGAVIRKGDDYVLIAEPYEDSPADKAGLQAGDKILSINGEDAKGLTTEAVSSKLKGDPGTDVKIKVEKFYTGKEEQLDIRRERISMQPVPYYGFISDSIGYIKHTDFSEDCSKEMLYALMEMKKSGKLKGLVLDYRNNGGGIMDEAVKILSMFVPRGTEVVSMKGRTSELSKVYETETSPVDVELPIVVLVNSGSASAAEIVAGAIQDLDRGVLVGQRTFGKGLVQTTKPVGYNSYLKVTTAKYYIPSGRCIQAVDYAHRAEDGSVRSVPDSLVKEFATAGGRKVYDGGGVMPDVRMSADYLSTFTVLTYANGYIEEFVDTYLRANPDVVDAQTFLLSDEAYEEFVRFMKDKDMEYKSETLKTLNTLKEKSEQELYYDKIKDAVAQIETELKDDKERDLKLYKPQLTDLIEDDIILRQHYRKGLIRRDISDDNEVKEAIRILSDPTEYNRIVTSQDTERK